VTAELEDVRPPVGEEAAEWEAVPRPAPTNAELRVLADNARYAEAVSLLEGVDLARLDPEGRYLAGVCLGSAGRADVAIDLLKSAADAGFMPFWCAFHLGLFEIKRGNAAPAAYYLAMAQILNPERQDLYQLLEQVAPGINPAPMRAAQAGLKARPRRKPPRARQLEHLINSMKYAEAAALLEGVDLSADLPPDFLYIAAVCVGAGDGARLATDLLKRAAEGGYPRFWCALNLGLFEEKLGRPATAAYYYSAALLANPERTDIWGLLARVAPDAELALLRDAQTGTRSEAAARHACCRGVEQAKAGSPAAAACSFAAALALDPLCGEARLRLPQLARGISLDVLADPDMDRLAAELCEKLTAPAAGEPDLERKIAWAEAVYKIYSNNDHPSGRTLIPALEEIFHRALAARALDLDPFCTFLEMFYFLYCWFVPDWGDMREIGDHVMKPAAAAIRDGTVRGVPAIVPRPLSEEPRRLGYLNNCLLPRNPVGRGVGDLLVALSRHLPGTYEIVIYAWEHHDEAFAATLVEEGIAVRRFAERSMTARAAAVAEAVAADRIDILISDLNGPLPTVLFERRIAPVQIFFQTGLPYWPLTHLDGVFRVEFYDPALDGFAREICFDLGLGAWQQSGYDYAPPVTPAQVVAERARYGLPATAKLAGIYGRLVKVKPYYLEMLTELLARHPDLVVVLGGTGQVKWIHDFIADRGLAGRLVLANHYVDGHVWGHMLDFFLDTSVDVTVAGREIMVKGKPIVCMRTPTLEHERVPMLMADTPAVYVEIASRLIEDGDFYKAACAATREFVAAQPGEREYALAVHDAVSTVVRRVRSRAHGPS
jgi:hypothetical protein